ncbi:DUF3231 family protein [Phosphitispora fastidiosa]|uniref:DUF3231 family protein n=1 Tax=Phosphitispora fastidiosa TaxID=2837202 RepID=UPI001E2F4276|nr:DUF3231 family protein [Phosphitispora fastidiosa]MBU7006800.1 spore coat protein CotF [Phosphitispora fastidiosa]
MDIVDVIADIKKITGITDSTQQKQQSLNVSDVWHLWDILVAKYDTIEVINILLNCARDADLKSVVKHTLKVVEKGADELQELMLEYAIPLPPRPPQSANTTLNLEVVTDKYIYNSIFGLIKQLMPLLAVSFNNSGSPIIINFFKNHIMQTMELVDYLSVYGEAKGYLQKLPMYIPMF